MEGVKKRFNFKEMQHNESPSANTSYAWENITLINDHVMIQEAAEPPIRLSPPSGSQSVDMVPVEGLGKLYEYSGRKGRYESYKSAPP